VNAIKNWVSNEPLLAKLGPVVLAVVGYLFVKGTIDKDTADLIIAVVAAVFGGGGLVAARAAVTPDSKTE